MKCLYLRTTWFLLADAKSFLDEYTTFQSRFLINQSIKIPIGHYGLSIWTETFGIFGLAHSCDAVISFVDLVSQ